MTKEQQYLAWACLPKEVRNAIRKEYRLVSKNPRLDQLDSVYLSAFEVIYGHHNLTSDTEPEEMLMVERKKVQELHRRFLKYKTEESLKGDTDFYDGELNALNLLFGDKCLPAKEPSVQVEPKFYKGDKVVIIKDCTSKGRICTINEVEWCSGIQSYNYRFKTDEVLGTWCEDFLEPYTEPETTDNMEEKELNLYELLKGCEGNIFFHPRYGDVEVMRVSEIYIELSLPEGGICNTPSQHCLHATGMAFLYPDAESLKKYPFDGIVAWQEWEEARKPKRWRAEKNERYWHLSGWLAPQSDRDDYISTDNQRYTRGNYFRTEELARQAAEAVRAALEKFHQEHPEQ